MIHLDAEGPSDAERKKILDSLIGNQEIREIVLLKEKFTKNHNTELTKDRSLSNDDCIDTNKQLI
jgi:hypothetical protein